MVARVQKSKSTLKKPAAAAATPLVKRNNGEPLPLLGTSVAGEPPATPPFGQWPGPIDRRYVWEPPRADTVLGSLAGYAGYVGLPPEKLRWLRAQGYYPEEDIANMLTQSQCNDFRRWHEGRLPVQYSFARDEEVWAYVPFLNLRRILNARRLPQ